MIREAIQVERERRGMSVSALARESGAHLPTLQMWLRRGDGNPTAATIEALCRVLDLELRMRTRRRPGA